MVFVLLAVLILLFLSIYCANKTPAAIKRWRRLLHLDAHCRMFQTLYAGIDGFALSLQARVKNDALEYTYGEINFESFIALLTLCKPDGDTVFYDLGAGCGKAVIACAMVFDVKKSCGIELFENLHDCAQGVRKQLSAVTDYADKSKTIQFQQGDFCSVSLPDATLVFINATAFYNAYWTKICRHLEDLAQGTLVLSTSKKVISKAYCQLYATRMQMSWGLVTVYIQKKIDIIL